MSPYLIKESPSEKAFKYFNYVLLTFFSLLTLYPIAHVINASFSDGKKLLAHSGFLFKPVGKFSLAAYVSVFRNPNIINGYLNTLFLIVFGVTSMVLVTALAAYFFSRKNVYFKNLLLVIIIFTMFFDGGLIPFYLLCRNLGLIDSRMSLILPFMVGTYNIIIMRTSFNTLPVSLEESAKIDGAGHLTILFKIIMPLSKAVTAVMFLFYGVGAWNGWFWATVFLRDRAKFPLQVFLREILIMNDMSTMRIMDDAGISESIKYATIVVATVPILMVYPFLQKYFTKGMLIGALKG